VFKAWWWWLGLDKVIVVCHTFIHLHDLACQRHEIIIDLLWYCCALRGKLITLTTWFFLFTDVSFVHHKNTYLIFLKDWFTPPCISTDHTTPALTIKNLTLWPQNLVVFSENPRTNWGYFPVQHWLTDFNKPGAVRAKSLKINQSLYRPLSVPEGSRELILPDFQKLGTWRW
jgi:hypothetical protein